MPRIQKGGQTIKRKSDGAEFFLAEGSTYPAHLYDVVGGSDSVPTPPADIKTENAKPVVAPTGFQRLPDGRIVPNPTAPPAPPPFSAFPGSEATTSPAPAPPKESPVLCVPL